MKMKDEHYKRHPELALKLIHLLKWKTLTTAHHLRYEQTPELSRSAETGV